MKKFIYTCVTPCYQTILINKVMKEFTFIQNEVYELPGNDKFVKSMIAQGHLKNYKTFKTEK